MCNHCQQLLCDGGGSPWQKVKSEDMWQSWAKIKKKNFKSGQLRSPCG